MMPRKTLIFALSLMLFSSVQVQTYGQSDSTYTMELTTARKLIHDAIRSYVQDSIIVLQEQRIEITEYMYGKLAVTVAGLTINHEQQIELERGKANDYKEIAEIHQEDAEKKGKGLKFWKGLGKVLGVIVVVETVILTTQ